MSTKIAFLGLGAIGAPMAAHLAKSGFDLTVWNRTHAKAEEFASKTGAKAASSPAEAVTEAEFIVTCMPASKEVEEVLSGTKPRCGSVVVDCTSGDPGSSRRIAGKLAMQGVAFMDAPVSGGVAGAEAGTLTVMCGGSAETLERARPMLEAFGKKIILCGAVGAGHAVKAVNNALLASHIITLAEGLLALQKQGVSADIALDIINASSGRSNASENLFPQRVLNRAFPRTFRLALLDKDVKIALGVAKEAGIPAPALELVAKLYAQAHAKLGEEADHVEIVRMIEESVGAEIQG